uniref:Sulfotransferase n=1 Tax=Schlesneria paludicola TaxID=360056 RepID=A0A7C2K1H2_9PLAN
MLISYSRRFLFIHNDKAAGSSVMKALEPHAEPTYRQRWRRKLAWLGPLNRLGGLYRQLDFPVHAPAAQVRQCLPPAVYDGLFKFMFVRNPWDRLVSRYAYLQQTAGHHRHRFVKRLPDFAAYVAWELGRGPALQADLCCDGQGRLIVDFIGRYETLAADFATICDKLGIAESLPHANGSRHRDYREFYTPALRGQVARGYARDIELFGYTFDVRSEQAAA